MALSHLAQLQVIRSQLHRAADTYRQALQLTRGRAGHLSPLAGIAHAGLGNLLYEWNNLETALIHLNSGYVGLARVRGAQGDWEGAFAAVEELLELCQRLTRRWLCLALRPFEPGCRRRAEIWKRPGAGRRPPV